MKIWNDNEVKSLFENVENCKKQNIALVQAFANHAQMFSRKQNSVRNYYYHEVDNLAKDKVRAAKLCIDLTKHTKSHFKNFDKIQEGDLFGEIDRLTASGFSVRAACLKLSGGDLPLMTRFQNKYQNMKRKIENNGNLNKNNVKKNDKSRVVLQNSQSQLAQNLGAKIIPFKVPSKITETDLNSLFLGLVRLVKKTLEEENLQKLNELKQNLLGKEEEIDALKSENDRLKRKLEENKQMALKRHLEKSKGQVNLQTAKRG